MNDLCLGLMLRVGQLVIDASLTLVIGVVVAGIFRRMVGPAGTRHLFGSGINGLVRGWIAGVLLPVCSLGVIPVAREMRRVGVPGGTVLSFVLAAPLLNPISFLYGLTLADPITILTFSAMSLGLSTVAGLLWERVFAGPNDTADSVERAITADTEPRPEYGIKRILAVIVTAARELTGRDLLYYAIGVFGSALLAVLIPNGSLQKSMQHADPTSPLLMTVLSLFVYATPLSGMMKIGLMFDHGNSVGAAFVLFSVGIGICLGTLVWLGCEFSWKRISQWFLGYVGVVLAFAYVAQPLLDDPRRERIDHTHAFDDYSAPFSAGSGTLERVVAGWGQKWTPLERPAVYAFVAMLGLGFMVRCSGRADWLERWLTTRHEQRRVGKLDVIVPGSVLAAVSLVGLVAFSVLAAYIYYPERRQCLDEMFAIYADARIAITSNRPESGNDKSAEAIRHLERWDLVARKLEVGTYLRTLTLTERQKSTAAALREAIEETRDHLRDGETQQAIGSMKTLESAYRAAKEAFSP